MQKIKLRATVDLMVDLEFFFNQPQLSLVSSVLKQIHFTMGDINCIPHPQ